MRCAFPPHAGMGPSRAPSSAHASSLRVAHPDYGIPLSRNNPRLAQRSSPPHPKAASIFGPAYSVLSPPFAFGGVVTPLFPLSAAPPGLLALEPPTVGGHGMVGADEPGPQIP